MINASKIALPLRIFTGNANRVRDLGEGVYGRTLGVGLGFEANIAKKVHVRKFLRSHWPSGVT